VNIKQRGSRYGAGLHFASGLAGLLLIIAGIRQEFQPTTEIWLSSALVVVIILHARMGFALSKAQHEVDMLEQLTARVQEDPFKAAKKIAPALNLENVDALSPEDTKILTKVREAIEGARVDLYLQPIVSLPQRKHRFYEAFSRLRDENGKVLKPASYLEAAERANSIGVIDNMILLRCIQALRQQRAINPQLVVFCNISPATIYDTKFFNHFTDYLELNTDLASSLVFEFTFPAVQMMHPRVQENIEAIARKGFAFSVDHVHSLNIDWQGLRERNFRYAKAPSSLLLSASRGDGASVQQLANFRKNLADAEIDLVAEKVEYESDMPEILSLGIDYGQGNLFGPPRRVDFYLGAHAQEELAKAS